MLYEYLLRKRENEDDEFQVRRNDLDPNIIIYPQIYHISLIQYS